MDVKVCRTKEHRETDRYLMYIVQQLFSDHFQRYIFHGFFTHFKRIFIPRPLNCLYIDMYICSVHGFFSLNVKKNFINQHQDGAYNHVEKKVEKKKGQAFTKGHEHDLNLIVSLRP